MKKLIMTVAVLAVAGIVSAQVYSSNIVGYAKTTLPAGGFELVAPAQFGGTASGITIDAAFSGLVGGEQLYVYNGVAYDIYTYFAGYGWFDALFAPAGGVVLPEGSSSWLKGGSGAVTITAGEVPSAASVSVTVVAGFNLISNPYPVALQLDNIDVSGFAGGETVYVFNGTAYDIYTYFAGYGWFDALFAPAGGVSIPVAKGFWLNAINPGSLVFNKLF